MTKVFSDNSSNDGLKPISDHMRSVMDDLVCVPFLPTHTIAELFGYARLLIGSLFPFRTTGAF